MKKFSTYNIDEKEIIDSSTFNNNLIKENISLEISGIEKPWSDDIDFKTNENLYLKIQEYINQEILKSNLELLEKLRMSYYQKNTITDIEENIQYIRKNIK